MKFWSIAFVALMLVSVVATKASNPNHGLTDHQTFSGVPVTTLRTPATP